MALTRVSTGKKVDTESEYPVQQILYNPDFGIAVDVQGFFTNDRGVTFMSAVWDFNGYKSYVNMPIDGVGIFHIVRVFDDQDVMLPRQLGENPAGYHRVRML